MAQESWLTNIKQFMNSHSGKYSLFLVSMIGSVKEVVISTEKQQQGGPPQIVRLDKPFKLAEQWVNNMSKDVLDEPIEVELECRPFRLGLGQKVARQPRVGHPRYPIGKKLHAKLEAGKRKAAKSIGGC